MDIVFVDECNKLLYTEYEMEDVSYIDIPADNDYDTLTFEGKENGKD